MPYTTLLNNQLFSNESLQTQTTGKHKGKILLTTKSFYKSFCTFYLQLAVERAGYRSLKLNIQYLHCLGTDTSSIILCVRYLDSSSIVTRLIFLLLKHRETVAIKE